MYGMIVSLYHCIYIRLVYVNDVKLDQKNLCLRYILLYTHACTFVLNSYISSFFHNISRGC